MQKRIVADVFMSVVLLTRQRRSAAVEHGVSVCGRLCGRMQCAPFPLSLTYTRNFNWKDKRLIGKLCNLLHLCDCGVGWS